MVDCQYNDLGNIQIKRSYQAISIQYPLTFKPLLLLAEYTAEI